MTTYIHSSNKLLKIDHNSLNKGEVTNTGGELKKIICYQNKSMFKTRLIITYEAVILMRYAGFIVK